jgi:hypothetical protein
MPNPLPRAHDRPPDPAAPPPLAEPQVEEWHDPTGGALLQILGACEAGEDGELPGLLEEMADGGHSIDTPGPDGDTAL